ncbi:MAG: glucuronyl hydrolase, partial [Arenibacter algicola]
MTNKIQILASIVILSLAIGCSNKKPKKSNAQNFDVDRQLSYCAQQATKTLTLIPKDGKSLPRNIAPDSQKWRFINYKDWTSG